MKKIQMVLLLLLFFILGIGIGSFFTYKENSKEEDFTEQATAVYKEFLDGKIDVDGIDIDFITIPTGEPDKRYETQYAFGDCDGDGEPELHVKSARYYYIFQYQNGVLQLYKDLSPYPYYYALQNGAFISHHSGAAPISDAYNYYIFDTFGNEILNISFEKYDENGNGKYDEGDEYTFDHAKVTKEVWDELTERYLYKDKERAEQIKNEIEWCELKY